MAKINEANRKHKFSHRAHYFKPEYRVVGFFDIIKLVMYGRPCKTCGLAYDKGKHK